MTVPQPLSLQPRRADAAAIPARGRRRKAHLTRLLWLPEVPVDIDQHLRVNHREQTHPTTHTNTRHHRIGHRRPSHEVDVRRQRPRRPTRKHRHEAGTHRLGHRHRQHHRRRIPNNTTPTSNHQLRHRTSTTHTDSRRGTIDGHQPGPVARLQQPRRHQRSKRRRRREVPVHVNHELRSSHREHDTPDHPHRHPTPPNWPPSTQPRS